MRKRRQVGHLQDVPPDSLLVCAADKAHNARDQMLDARCWGTQARCASSLPPT